MRIKPGDIITCKDYTVYQVVETISNELALLNLETFKVIQPDVIPTFISMYHLGVECIEDIDNI